MPKVERYLFAKFKRDEETRFVSSFFASEDKGRVLAWTGNESRGNDEAKSITTGTNQLSFKSTTSDFLEVMNSFHRLIPTTLGVMPVIRHMELEHSVLKLAQTDGLLLEKSQTYEVYQLPIDRVGLFDRNYQGVRALQRGTRSLRHMFLLGLVSSYDAFLAKLLTTIYLNKPELLSASERNISFREITELGSIEAARTLIIDKEVEAFLRKSHDDQVDWLEKRLSIPLTKGLDIWATFVELCERRNLFTHTGGVVSQQYLSKCAANKCEVEGVKIGDQLSVDAKYLRRSVDVISELGLKLIQVIWRKLNQDEISEAATSLNNVGYTLIAGRRYRLAVKMLDFGLNGMKKHGSDAIKKMMVVNLANAQKLGGDKDAASATLDREDWTATNEQFKICVAAVRGNVEEVVKAMADVVKSGQMEKANFREWPVFQQVKDAPEFIAEFERVFEEPFFVEKESVDGANQDHERSGTEELPSAGAPSVSPVNIEK